MAISIIINDNKCYHLWKESIHVSQIYLLMRHFYKGVVTRHSASENKNRLFIFIFIINIFAIYVCV